MFPAHLIYALALYFYVIPSSLVTMNEQEAAQAFVHQQQQAAERQAAQAFMHQQQVQQQQAAASQSLPGSINLTPQQLQDMLSSVGNQAAQQAVSAVHASHTQPQNSLPKSILNLVKPPPYENKAKSGKFIHFERGVRQFIRVQGLQPEAHFQHNQQCRTIVEVCCVGEALSYIHRLAETLPQPHSFYTFEGLLKTLKDHFTFTEETDQARKELDSLKLTRGMSARTYVQKFNSLLDDIPNMSVKDQLFAFSKGLPTELDMWVRHDAPQTLEDAQNLVIRMSSSEPSPPVQSPEPMQINSLHHALQRTTDRLARLEMAPRSSVGRARDPRTDRRWPRWGRVDDRQIAQCKQGNKCFLCFQPGHPWPACPRLHGQRSPSAQSLQRSPSPPNWRARPSSPSKSRPNFQRPW